MTDPSALYRPCVGIMLIQNGLIFAGKRRSTSSSAWQMPQGGIDDGEKPQTALWRELLEEVGTDKALLLEESENWFFYDLPKEIQGTLWGGSFVGQRQKWFALNFTGTDADINLNFQNPPEFLDWQWVTPEQLLDRVVDFKRELYKEVLDLFSPHLKGE